MFVFILCPTFVGRSRSEGKETKTERQTDRNIQTDGKTVREKAFFDKRDRQEGPKVKELVNTRTEKEECEENGTDK